jgi:TRAP-type C4-dicarboxylate transport system substrate-binding protein
MTTRRAIVAASVLALATAMSGGAAFGQQRLVLKATDVHPLGYPTVEAVVRMGKKLVAATNGRISIQMFPSMQLGVVDGAENNEPSYASGQHYRYAKYYSMTQHLIIPEILVFSKKTWNTLSKDDQALIIN